MGYYYNIWPLLAFAAFCIVVSLLVFGCMPNTTERTVIGCVFGGLAAFAILIWVFLKTRPGQRRAEGVDEGAIPIRVEYPKKHEYVEWEE